MPWSLMGAHRARRSLPFLPGGPGALGPRPPPNKELGLPFQVIQKEEEGQQVGLWERQQQVKHAALFCNGV